METESRRIKIVETEIGRLEHTFGYLQRIILVDGISFPITTLNSHNPYAQNCTISETLVCELNDPGYIKIDSFQKQQFMEYLFVAASRHVFEYLQIL